MTDNLCTPECAFRYSFDLQQPVKKLTIFLNFMN